MSLEKHSGHLVRDSIYSIDLILNQWKKNSLGKIKVKKPKKHIKVFKKYGTDCVYCGLKGSYFATEKHRKDHCTREWHLNLYAKVPFSDGIRIMTIDHVIPKSKGGTNRIENLRPACIKCNTKKSDMHVDKWLAKRKKIVTHYKKVIDWARFFEWDGWKRRIKYMWYTHRLPALPTKRKWIEAKCED